MQKCSGCDSILSVGDVVVVADRAGKNHVWEPACFTCSKCDEILVNLIYFFKESKLYCGRHYCEMMKPRCTACDEVNFLNKIFIFQLYYFFSWYLLKSIHRLKIVFGIWNIFAVGNVMNLLEERIMFHITVNQFVYLAMRTSLHIHVSHAKR